MARNRKKKTYIPDDVNSEKKIPRIYDPSSYKKTKPVWSFDFADFEHEKWNILHSDFINKNQNKSIFKSLKDFEGMTWQEIDSSSGGRAKGTNNHFIKFDQMIKDAQTRAIELNLFELCDSLYSLRLSGKQRLFGILYDGIFHIVWYDCEHEICPSGKK